MPQSPNVDDKEEAQEDFEPARDIDQVFSCIGGGFCFFSTMLDSMLFTDFGSYQKRHFYIASVAWILGGLNTLNMVFALDLPLWRPVLGDHIAHGNFSALDADRNLCLGPNHLSGLANGISDQTVLCANWRDKSFLWEFVNPEKYIWIPFS